MPVWWSSIGCRPILFGPICWTERTHLHCTVIPLSHPTLTQKKNTVYQWILALYHHRRGGKYVSCQRFFHPWPMWCVSMSSMCGCSCVCVGKYTLESKISNRFRFSRSRLKIKGTYFPKVGKNRWKNYSPAELTPLIDMSKAIDRQQNPDINSPFSL